MPRRCLLAALSFVLVASACRTAGPPAPPGVAGASDPLGRYVGELRLLRHEASRRQIRLGARSRVADGCAVAVLVREAAFVKGSARLSLETLGTPRLPDRRVECRRMQSVLDLTVSGFSANPSAAELVARIDVFLQSPEAYLASQGVRFDLAAGEAPAEAASRETFATNDEARLARSVTAWPVALVSVDPWYRDPARRTRQQSEIDLEAVVGGDGRLYRPRLRTGLAEAHARAVLRSLPLWRFAPARRGDAPLAARVSLRPVLHIY